MAKLCFHIFHILNIIYPALVVKPKSEKISIQSKYLVKNSIEPRGELVYTIIEKIKTDAARKEKKRAASVSEKRNDRAT